jgi:ribosome-binding protein aMBF1 (putative translation factor)
MENDKAAAMLSKIISKGLEEDKLIFSDIVTVYLNTFAFEALAKKKLAEACEVAPTTIERWASGSSLPGKNVQKFIVEKILSVLQTG